MKLIVEKFNDKEVDRWFEELKDWLEGHPIEDPTEDDIYDNVLENVFGVDSEDELTTEQQYALMHIVDTFVKDNIIENLTEELTKTDIAYGKRAFKVGDLVHFHFGANEYTNYSGKILKIIDKDEVLIKWDDGDDSEPEEMDIYNLRHTYDFDGEETFVESLKEENMNRYKVDYTVRDRNQYGLHFKKGTRTVTAATEAEAKEKIEQDLVDKIYVDNIKLVESLTEGAANFGKSDIFNLSSPKEEFDEDNYDFDPYEDGYLFIKDQLEGLENYVKVEPGYHEGYYIKVRFDNVEDFLNEVKDEEFYNFSDEEINPNELLEEANKRINEIKEALTKSIQYGYLTNYLVAYRFSSGEAGYELINETKKDLEVFNKEITDFAKEVKEEIFKNVDKDPYNVIIFGWNDEAEQFTDVEHIEKVYDLEDAKKIADIEVDKAFRYYDDVYAEVRDKDGNVVHTTKVDLEEAADPKALKKLGMPTKAEAENIDIKHPTKDEAEKELKLKDERTFELDKAFAGKLKEEIDVEGLKAQIKELEELEDKTVEQFTELKNLQDKLNLKEEKTDNTLIIKQALIDLDNEDYHDLVNMYEAITLTEEERLELANLLSGKGDIMEVYDFLVTRLNETFNYEFK